MVLVSLLSRVRRKEALRVSEGSLRAIRRAERERALAEESDRLRARLLSKPGFDILGLSERRTHDSSD